MNDRVLQCGQIVRSKAGRDKGRLFLVVEVVDENYVKISDGDLRKIEKPKKKKIRHLQKTNQIIYEAKEKLERNKDITNADIRRYLEQIPE